MSRRRLPLAVLGLLLLGSGPCECLKPVTQCAPGTHCLSYEDFCAQVQPAVFCENAKACGGVAPDVPCDQAGLTNWAFDPYCDGALTRAVDAGTVIFHSANAGSCLQQLRTTCGATCGLQAYGLFDPVLTRASGLFEGTLEQGEQCHLSEECRAGLWCDTDLACPSRCTPQVRAGELSPSMAGCRTFLGAGLTEQVGHNHYRCVEPAAQGERCEPAPDEAVPHRVCQLGLICARWPIGPGDSGLDGGPTDGGSSDGGG